jgi:hypothetical protein
MNTSRNWPPFLVELVDSCPAAGDGVNFWLYKVARHLHAHLDPESIFTLLKTKTRGCGRPVRDQEILRQIRESYAKAWRPLKSELFPLAEALPAKFPGLERPPPAWSEHDLDRINAVVTSGPGLYDLWEQSPTRFEDNESHAEEIIDRIFPGNPRLCVGKANDASRTRRRECWRGHLHRLPFIVPNPMLARRGHPQGKKRWSEHTLEATGRRVYLVIECDFALKARDGIKDSAWAPLVREWEADGISVADACAALLWHLKNLLPLVLVVHSGGKSLHGWFRVFGQNEAHLRSSFMEKAVSLGADKATWTRSQFVRIPDGRRDNGKVQRTFYFDPREAIM